MDTNGTSSNKILRVATRLNIGGPSRHIYFLSSFLNPGQFDTLLIHGSLAKGEKRYPVFPKVRMVHVPDLVREPNLGRDLKAFLKILRLILSERPQIVHSHMAKAGVLTRLAAWFCSVPVRVHTYHGHVFDGYFSSWKTRLFIMLERFLAGRSDCLVAMGKEIASELVEKYRITQAEKVRVFYPGLDLTEYLDCAAHRGILRTELGLTQQHILVAFIGRLCTVKRPKLFIKIAEAVIRQNSNFRFLMVGGGEEEDSVTVLIKERGLQDKVILLGWRDDLPVIYSDVDIVAQCSSDEGTPNVLIEALACSKPVVATHVGAIPEIVQHGKSGLLVDRDDEEGFVDALLALGRDPVLRNKMGCFGREFVKDRFSVHQLVEHTERLYQELLITKK